MDDTVSLAITGPGLIMNSEGLQAFHPRYEGPFGK
jgi:hypothetical protein